MISSESMIYLMNDSAKYCGNQEQWNDVLAQLGVQASQPPPLLVHPKMEIMDDDDIILGEGPKLDFKFENFSPPDKNSLASTSSRSITPNSTDDDIGVSWLHMNASKQRCAVCGDASTGFHYDTASCNGCKTFFRRTVVTGRMFVCKKGNRCSFDKNGRCACRACRFAKCVAAGMNPQAIQYTPSANLTLSIARKCFMKAKKSAMKQPRLVERPLGGVQDEILRRIGHVLHLEEKYTRLRNSTYNPYNEDLTLNELLKFHTSFGEAERWPLVEQWPQRPKLTNVIRDNLRRNEQAEAGIKFWYYLDLYLSVDYLKTFDVFNELSSADKAVLCQAIAIPNYHFANSYYSYQQKSDITIFPDGYPQFFYRSESELMDIEKILRLSVIEPVGRMKMDQIQYSLLRAIIALHDGCRKLSPEARDRLSKERAKYTTALLRYLQNKHGVDLGNRRFGDSLAILHELFYRARHNFDYYTYRKYVEHTDGSEMISPEAMLNYLMGESMRQYGTQDQWPNVLAQLQMQNNVPQQQPTVVNMPMPIPMPIPIVRPKVEVLDDDSVVDVDEINKIACKYENFSPANHSLASTSTGSMCSPPSVNEDDLRLAPRQRCAVCSDTATGYHYDTPSCNGCKTFFRRTVVAGRKFICKLGGRYGRCACRACRFQKCVNAGMNAHAIQYNPSANLTLSIARKVFMKAKRKQPLDCYVEAPLPATQDEILRRIGHVLHLEEKYARLRSSTFFPYKEEFNLNDLLHVNTSFGEAERYPVVEKWPVRGPEHFKIPVQDAIKMGFKFWYYLDLYLSVDYIKTFDVFNELNDSDRYHLSKSIAIPNYLLTNAYFSYLQRSDIVIFPDGYKFFTFKKEEEMLPIEKMVRDGVVNMVSRLKMDQIQYSLLRAIMTLHDGCLKLSPEGRAVISNERAKFTTALLRYLQNKHGIDLGTRRFGESLACLTEVFYRSHRYYDFHAYMRYVKRCPAPGNLMADLLLNRGNSEDKSKIKVLS